MPIRINEQIHPAVPIRYFPNDHPAGVPLFQWKAHANLLFANWLNYEGVAKRFPSYPNCIINRQQIV